MFVVRPVETADLPAFEALVADRAHDVHSLPRSRTTIAHAIENSVASFAGVPRRPSNESYLFVLASAVDGALAGTAAIAATAGAHGTFFAFRRDVLSQVSRDLGISHDVHALSLCSDLTAHSQLSGFYLRGRHARTEAVLLSRARMLFAALAPHRFADRFFASMPGVAGNDGSSPFWEALGRKFFQMDFTAAERLVEGARNRSFIVELMPHYPVYVPLLPPAAQEAMGGVHPQGQQAFDMLREEGFEAEAYLDVFDGGVILQGQRKALRSFMHARRLQARVMRAEENIARGRCLVANTQEENFRATLIECVPGDESVMLDEAAMRILQVAPGDAVMCLRL